MADKVFVRDLLLRTIIGINDDERTKLQDVVINIEMTVDTRPAGDSDSIDDAINYRTITKQVVDLVEGSSYFLVEKLAEEISRLCLSDPRVQAARVRVEKPGALRFTKAVGVEIERLRRDSIS